MNTNLGNSQPDITLNHWDSNPHPGTLLRYMSDILIRFGNESHDHLIAKALRIARNHPACVTRKDRSREAIITIVKMMRTIRALAEVYGYTYDGREVDGYHVYEFSKKQ